jgi:hypothetical protein
MFAVKTVSGKGRYTTRVFKTREEAEKAKELHERIVNRPARVVEIKKH